MKHQPWQRFELDLLVDVAGKMPIEDIAGKLERTPNAVKNKAHYFNISLAMTRITKAWTPEECALFHTHSDTEMMLITGRSRRSISGKRYQLKIYRRAA